MLWDLARAKESDTSPRPAKGPLRRRKGTTDLGCLGPAMVLQGALTRLTGQGLRADLSSPPCYFGDRFSVN